MSLLAPKRNTNQFTLPLAWRIILPFAGLILTGFITLYLWGFAGQPQSAGGRAMAAFFTAVSGVCVTGLSVIDISRELNVKGKIILLLLMQLGGLGIITLSNWFLLSIRGKMTLNETQTTSETYGFLANLPARALLKRVIRFTLVAETLGTAALGLRFSLNHTPGEALWLGLFHSISAFCNAGFTLFSTSLEGFYDDPWINIAIITLIISGGLGFVVFADIAKWLDARRKGRRLKFSLHTRIVLITSAALTATGMLLFLAFEWNNLFHSHSALTKITSSLFLSVTARTAGFNTVTTGHLTGMSLSLLIILMIIGASSGSTGGGIKTTTAAMLYAIFASHLKNRPQVELYNSTIPYPVVSKVMGIVSVYLITAFVAIIALQAVEIGGLPYHSGPELFLDYVFETISALSTVGLSTGITPNLSIAGQLIIIFCMFGGRVGLLALVTSIIGERKGGLYTYPTEEVMVG